MPRPLLLDLYCKAGGATKGYMDAGFDVVGVDIEPQPNYPGMLFIQADVIEFLRDFNPRAFIGEYVAIHASPPCQDFSPLKARTGKTYPRLIAPTRELLERTGLPYVIENVAGARQELRDPAMLCGSMFGLPLTRHRYFETNWPLETPRCNHALFKERWPEGFPALRSDRTGRASVVGVYGTGGGAAKDVELWKWAMEIDWMTKAELAEAIPPAYSRYVGEQLLAAL